MKNTAHVLIVDDTELNRDVLEGLVASLGHKPMIVSNGKEALEVLEKGPLPDLILLDILMPEISGFDVLKHVKNSESLRSLPVIMISIIDEMESIVRCIELGADDFMTKPFNAILLKARINACLARKEYEDKQKQFSFWLADSYQKLQKAEQVRDEMFNMVVHDMNNALTILLGETELLTEQQATQLNADIRNSINNIGDAGRQIKSMVGNILDISRMEMEQISPRKEPVNIVHLVDNTSKQFNKMIKSHNGRLSTSSSSQEIFCNLDSQLLQRILQNLLTNVIKHGLTNDNPTVHIDITANDTNVTLSITDNGTGVPEDQIDKIFRKYYKLNSSNKGLGLGLAICKMAVEAMGGTITCGASNTSGGAKFCLVFNNP